MCLPFDCCQKTDHGSNTDHGTRPSRVPDHRRDDGYQYDQQVAWPPDNGANRGYGGYGRNGAGNAAPGRAAPGVNMNREAGEASDSDGTQTGLPVRNGAAAKTTAPAAPVPQTAEHWPPTPPTWGGAQGSWEANTPAPQAQVAAGARHQGSVATSQPRERVTRTTQTPPVPQVARRDEDYDYSAQATSSYSKWR